MKRIRKYFTEIEAEQARSLLAEEGVPAYVEGANAQTALAYIGSALGGVKLLVDEADMQRAEEILQRSQELPNIEAWTCGNCYSEVDPGFAVCWRCGADYTQAAPIEEEQEASDSWSVDYSAAAAEQPEPTQDSGNPYQAPNSHQALATASRHIESVSASPESEAKVHSAWLAAVVGVVILPGLANLLSLFWLLQAVPHLPTLSAQARRRFWIAAVVDVIAIAVTALLLTSRLS